MDFLLGFVGAVAAMALAAVGFFAGYRVGKIAPKVTAEPVDLEERQRLRQELAAFQQLQNYSAETAYGGK